MSKQLTTYLTRAQKFSLTGLFLVTSVIFLPSLILVSVDNGVPLQHSYLFNIQKSRLFPILLSLPLVLALYVYRFNCEESSIIPLYEVWFF